MSLSSKHLLHSPARLQRGERRVTDRSVTVPSDSDSRGYSHTPIGSASRALQHSTEHCNEGGCRVGRAGSGRSSDPKVSDDKLSSPSSACVRVFVCVRALCVRAHLHALCVCIHMRARVRELAYRGARRTRLSLPPLAHSARVPRKRRAAPLPLVRQQTRCSLCVRRTRHAPRLWPLLCAVRRALRPPRPLAPLSSALPAAMGARAQRARVQARRTETVE